MEERGKKLNIRHHDANPQWNYTISPRSISTHVKKDKSKVYFAVDPKQCWDKHYVKDPNDTVWGILKKLIVSETFVECYRDTPLEAEVLEFSKAKDGFLHLRNVEYDKILNREYRVCIPLVSLFQNKGSKWINDIQNMPISEILDWIRRNWKELRGWIRGTGLEIDEDSLTEERCRRVIVSLMPPHILRELVKM